MADNVLTAIGHAVSYVARLQEAEGEAARSHRSRQAVSIHLFQIHQESIALLVVVDVRIVCKPAITVKIPNSLIVSGVQHYVLASDPALQPKYDIKHQIQQAGADLLLTKILWTARWPINNAGML